MDRPARAGGGGAGAGAARRRRQAGLACAPPACCGTAWLPRQPAAARRRRHTTGCCKPLRRYARARRDAHLPERVADDLLGHALVEERAAAQQGSGTARSAGRPRMRGFARAMDGDAPPRSHRRALASPVSAPRHASRGVLRARASPAGSPAGGGQPRRVLHVQPSSPKTLHTHTRVEQRHGGRAQLVDIVDLHLLLRPRGGVGDVELRGAAAAPCVSALSRVAPPAVAPHAGQRPHASRATARRPAPSCLRTRKQHGPAAPRCCCEPARARERGRSTARAHATLDAGLCRCVSGVK
jgi:hypothetical protein